MKLRIPIAWFILSCLCISSAYADVSLPLANKQYLPPPIQELPINEGYLKAEQQDKFKENSYGNSRYQIFEVHNQYETPRREGGNELKSVGNQRAFANKNFESEEKIPIEHSVDDFDFDTTYLVPFPSNFRHTFPEKSQNAAQLSFSSMQQYHSQNSGRSGFRGTEYLPPTSQYFRQPAHSSVAAQSYQVTQQQGHSNAIDTTSRIQDYSSNQIVNNNKDAFKGPDYFPPEQQNSLLTQQTSEHRGFVHLSPHQQDVNRVVQQSLVANEVFKDQGYLPPQQHLSSQTYENLEHDFPFKSSDYEGYYQSDLNQFKENVITRAQFKGPDYLPPQTNLEAPNYLPPAQLTSRPQENQPFRSNEQFKGPDYLPPQNHLKASSQVTDKPLDTKQFRPSKEFKGPEYLPPQNFQNINRERNGRIRSADDFQLQLEAKNFNNPFKSQAYQPPNQFQTKSPVKGTGYFPPVQNRLQPEQQQYLPEGYDFKKPPNAEQAIKELHQPVSQVQIAEPNESVNPNCVPEKQVESSSNSGNSPAGYDFKNPDNSEQPINLLHSQEASTTSTTQSIQAPQRSLPVYHFQRTFNAHNNENQLHNFDSSQQLFRPDTAEQVINVVHGQHSPYKNNQLQITQSNHTRLISAQTYEATDQAINTVSQPEARQFAQPKLRPFKGPDYLPPAEYSRNIRDFEYLPPTLRSQGFRDTDLLPPSSEYLTSKGENLFTSTTLAFKGPDYLPPASGSTRTSFPRETGPKVLNNPGYVSLSSEYPTSNREKGFTSTTTAYKGPDYLPPAKVFKGPDYLPPVNKQPAYELTPHHQFRAPDYLPPTEHNTIQMYPLSSYMTNIKPNDRYGNRRPFPEYGLPPAKQITSSNGNDISSMYRQPTIKPQYYAPAMSYTNNALSTQAFNQLQTTATLSQEARQALQVLMPEDIRQTTTTNNFQAKIPASTTTTTLQVPKTAKTKIRTVQIVKPNAVKTLKILESLDHTGVRTIKILSSSNDLPVGNHRIVKVVSGSNDQSVQTVNIFNDHQDFVPNEDAAPTVAKGNSYLPPTTVRNRTSKPNP